MLDSENLLHPVLINQDKSKQLPPPEEEEKKVEEEKEKDEDADDSKVEEIEDQAE